MYKLEHFTATTTAKEGKLKKKQGCTKAVAGKHWRTKRPHREHPQHKV
jgi:hypothetical protein